MLKMTIEFNGCVDCPFHEIAFNRAERICGRTGDKINIDEMDHEYKWPSVCPMREIDNENSNP